jgi:hypothetical protein
MRRGDLPRAPDTRALQHHWPNHNRAYQPGNCLRVLSEAIPGPAYLGQRCYAAQRLLQRHVHIRYFRRAITLIARAVLLPLIE